MYKLTFKGKDLEPIFLEDDKGKIVMEAYLGNKSVRLVANNQAFNTGDIKTIHLVEKTRGEMYSQPTTNQEKEYADFRKKMLSLSIEQRANIIRIPKLVWQSNTSQEMTAEVKKEIVARQLAYFTEHPNCIYANPICYRDLIPLPTERGGKKDDPKHINQIIGGSMMRFIENAISTDLQLSLRA